MSLLNNNQRWVGEFFAHSDGKQRFSGEVRYSPEEGVNLEYFIVDNEVIEPTKILYGILDSGECCTLVGYFSPSGNNPSLSFNNGCLISKGKVSFQYMVLGVHLDANITLNNFSFIFSGLQEFFFPSGTEDTIEFQEKPIFKVKTELGDIQIENRSKFKSLSNIEAQLYSWDKRALEDLSKSFILVSKRYPDSSFFLKQDLKYQFRFIFRETISIVQAYKFIFELANLFALLTYRPVRLDSLQVQISYNDDESYPAKVFPSMRIGDKILGRCLETQFHHSMPININNINLEETLNNWWRFYRSYSEIASAIQHDYGDRNEHSVHGSLILYAALLESISYQEDRKKSKYEYPITQYGSKKIRERLLSIFSEVNENEVGSAISTLRNEIAHIGKPRKIIERLSTKDLAMISQGMQLVVIGYILCTLGLDKNVVMNYQDYFMS